MRQIDPKCGLGSTIQGFHGGLPLLARANDLWTARYGWRVLLSFLRGSFWVLLLGLAACAGPRFDGALFRKPGVSYRIEPLGPGWERVRVEGSDLSFHRERAGTVSAQATCREYEDVPPSALVNHLLFGTTRRVYLLDEEVTLDGRGARHALVDCELDGVPVRVEVYLLVRNGCVFDLSYVSDRSAPAQAEFTRFVQAFRIESAGRD